MASIGNRIKNAWSAFNSTSEPDYTYQDLGYGSTYNPNRPRLSGGNERSIVATVTSRIAMDVASFDIQHVKTDQNGRYIETLDSSLNSCLTIEANKDQTGRTFIQDVVMSMFDEGVVAIVPVLATVNIRSNDIFKVEELRTAKVMEWYPDHIRVEIYNDIIGRKQIMTLPKKSVAIIENPLYAVMNEPNSTLKRLTRKLSLLDIVDDKTSAGKLDLIIQLPYTVKSESRQKQAEERIASIAKQMEGSQYGIAYADATERITQLNRPVENNLLTQVQYLTTTFYNQLGMSEDIFTGKASEQVLRNYYDRTIEPIVTAIVEEMSRKFLSKTARTQGQMIMGFRDVLRLVTVSELANIADVLSRNEILSPNELRQVIGRKPSKDSKADELSNRNMPKEIPSVGMPKAPKEEPEPVRNITKQQAEEKINKLRRDLDSKLI